METYTERKDRRQATSEESSDASVGAVSQGKRGRVRAARAPGLKADQREQTRGQGVGSGWFLQKRRAEKRPLMPAERIKDRSKKEKCVQRCAAGAAGGTEIIDKRRGTKRKKEEQCNERSGQEVFLFLEHVTTWSLISMDESNCGAGLQRMGKKKSRRDASAQGRRARENGFGVKNRPWR